MKNHCWTQTKTNLCSTIVCFNLILKYYFQVNNQWLQETVYHLEDWSRYLSIALEITKEEKRGFYVRIIINFNVRENADVSFYVNWWSWSSFVIFLNHLRAFSYLFKITLDKSDWSPRGQSEILRDLYKYPYLSNESFVCDEICTIYRQDNIDVDTVWVLFLSYFNTEKFASESQ